MFEWISAFEGLDLAFLGAAIIGGIVFVFRLASQLLGLEHHEGADISPEHLDSDMGDSDISFKLLTVQGVAGFLVMFGLVGLVLSREVQTGTLVAMVGAVAAGFLTLLVIQKSYDTMFKMQSSGNLDYKQAIHKEGTVYLTVPAAGQGQVQVAFQSKLHLLNAISAKEEELTTGSKIRVTGVSGENVLIVEKI